MKNDGREFEVGPLGLASLAKEAEDVQLTTSPQAKLSVLRRALHLAWSVTEAPEKLTHVPFSSPQVVTLCQPGPATTPSLSQTSCFTAANQR